MALVKLSGLVSDIRGQIGGTTFKNSSAGLVMQTSTSPVNKNSLTQNIQRSIINDLQQQWRLLTDEERACWVLYTKLFPLKQKNITGNVINAQQTFIKVNVPFRLYNLSIIKQPGLVATDLEGVTFTLTRLAAGFRVNYSRVLDETREFVVLFITYIKNLSVNNPGTTYKAIIFETRSVNRQLIGTPYFNIFGFTPIVGDTVFFKANIVDLANGQQPFFTGPTKITL